MEVCVDSVLSARNAFAGGAARIELCSALSEGGLTPSVGFLQVVKSLVSIPVFVMIRPRRGMDFIYSDEEVDVMETDLNTLKLAGADGFVFGSLTHDGRVNKRVCERLLKVAAPLPCTFHRAFDVIKQPKIELETIINLGFQRILTSGQEESALKGLNLLKELVKISNDRILMMPGAGVCEANLELILKETGVKEFHASARSRVNIESNSGNVSMGAADNDLSLLVTNQKLVEEMVKISKQLWTFEEKD